MKTFQIIIFLLAYITSALPGHSSEKLLAKNTVMATVNGEPITLFDVLADSAPEEKQIFLLYSGKQLEQERNKIRNKALNFIIDRKLVYEQFKKKGYKLPKQIIEKMLDQLAADLSGGDRKLLESKARKAGLTMEDLREQAKERAATSILIYERCYRNVYITPKQVYDYYRNNRAEFITPSRIKLQVLYLKSESENKSMADFTEKLRKLLENADEKTFSEYVGLHSEGPNKESGGKVGWISEEKLRTEFILPLKGKGTGTIAGPITTQEGFYFIRIADREESDIQEFENIKDDIRKKLSEAKEKKTYNTYISRLKKGAVIKITDADNQ